jgi:hypothetical protein
MRWLGPIDQRTDALPANGVGDPVNAGGRNFQEKEIIR